jgi:beta-lactamase superfamily II metal-dependent hydrolase
MLSALGGHASTLLFGGLVLAVSCSSQRPVAGASGDTGAGAISGASGASNGEGGASSGGRGGSRSTSNGGSSGSGLGGRGGSAGEGGGATGGGGGIAGSGPVPETLDIYWVDVEGGAATIIRTPDGEVLLADTGHPGGRDAARILSVLEEQVGADRLDHVIITHYHADHVGGAAQIAAGIDVMEFIDHGESVEEGEGEGYPELALDRRRSVVPGDTISFGDVTLTIVQSHGLGIDARGSDTANPACASADPGTKEPDEDAMSVGYLIEFGSFQFLDLGDLTWGYEHDLVCPVNKLGEVDLFQVPQHGLEISSPPQLLSALNPLVSVIGNGPDTGNLSVTYERLLAIPSLEAVWTIHRALEDDAEDSLPEERIANLEDGASDEAHFVHVAVSPSGEFSVQNSRNGYAETYQAR